MVAASVAVMLLLGTACESHDTAYATPSPRPSPLRGEEERSYIYAAQSDGKVQVYDMDHSHHQVKAIQAFACCADVRGAAAAAPTHRFYVMYNRDNHGHVLAIDLLTDQVLWDRVVHSPGVDRGNLTPNGRNLYLPTYEGDPGSPYELVLDAMTGAEVGRIALPLRSHDTIVSLDGRRVFMETKSPTHAMYVADTATNQVVKTISGYCCTGILAPFSINGAGTTIVNDVYGYYGFAVADTDSGRVTNWVPFTGTRGSTGHGIAWTPDESEVWADDGGNPYVHVFDMTASPPVQTHLVRVSNVSPHWITFSRNGQYAYVAGRKGSDDPTDIIDPTTYLRIGALAPSEDLLEVDFDGGAVSAVGNQFGVGRVVEPRRPLPIQ